MQTIEILQSTSAQTIVHKEKTAPQKEVQYQSGMHHDRTRGWMLMALINLVVAVALGLLLRYMQFSPVKGVNIGYLIHAHSHVAMLGWLYIALYTYFVRLVMIKRPFRYKIYRFWFQITQVSVFGMLFSFIYQGYGPVSIAFSALHILLSYIFALNIFKDLRKSPLESTIQNRYIKTSLYFMIVATFGVWAMGPVIAITGKHSILYNLAIQFYLHFYINGWIVFAVLALVIPKLTRYVPGAFKKRMMHFHHLLVAATVLTFLLPVAWFTNTTVLYYGNALGVLLQLLAGAVFFRMILSGMHKKMNAWIITALGYFALKIIFQAFLVSPEFTEAAFGNRMLVVAFLHLIMVGFASHYLLAYLKPGTRLLKFGSAAFISGVAITELMQFVQGGLLLTSSGWVQGFNRWLFVFSILILIGLVCLMIVHWKGRVVFTTNDRIS